MPDHITVVRLADQARARNACAVTRVCLRVRAEYAAVIRMETMLDLLGLPYGAIDFAVTPEGKWQFLEWNPSGQYGFIEQATGLPITAAICDYLEGNGP